MTVGPAADNADVVHSIPSSPLLDNGNGSTRSINAYDNDNEATTPPPPPQPETATTNDNNTPTTIDRPFFPRFYDSEEEGRSLVFVESQSSLSQLASPPPIVMHNSNINLGRNSNSSSSNISSTIHNESSNSNSNNNSMFVTNSNIDNNVMHQQDTMLSSANSFVLSSSISEDDEGNNSVVRVLGPPSYGVINDRHDDLHGRDISSNTSNIINNSSQLLLPYQHRKKLNARNEEEMEQQHHQHHQHQHQGVEVIVRPAKSSVGAPPSSPQKKQNMQQQQPSSSNLSSKFMVAPIPPFRGTVLPSSSSSSRRKPVVPRQQLQPSSSDDNVDDEDDTPKGYENVVVVDDAGQGQWGSIRKVKSANASPSVTKKRKKKEKDHHHHNNMPHGSGLSSPNATQYDNNRPPRAPPHPHQHQHHPQQLQQQQQQQVISSAQHLGAVQHLHHHHHHHQDVIDPNLPPPPPPPLSPPSSQHFSPRGNSSSGGFHIRINSQGSISSLGSNAGVDDAVAGESNNFYSAGGGATTTTRSAHRSTGRQYQQPQPPQQRNNQQMPPQSNSREYWYYPQQQQQQQQQRYVHNNPPPRGDHQQQQHLLPPQQQQPQQQYSSNYNVNYNAVLGQEVAQFLHGEHIAKAAEWNQRQQQNRTSRTQHPYDPYGPPPYGWNPQQPSHGHAYQHQWSPQQHQQQQQQQHPYGWYDDHQDRRRHHTQPYGHFTPEPQAPHQKYSQQRQMQPQQWDQYGAVTPASSPRRPYQLSQNERHDEIPSEKRSLLLPSSAGIRTGSGGGDVGGEGWRGMPPQRKYEVPLQNAAVHVPENEKKKKKGERRRYQKEKRRQFYPSDSSEEDTSDNRRDWSSSSSHHRAKSKKNGRSSSSRSQRRKRHSHHRAGKATPSQHDESLSETHSESLISNSLADRSRTREGVGVFHQLYISTKLLICNLPLSFAAISFSIALLGKVWLKWTQEIVPSCKEVNFHTSQCNFPDFPGCYFCDEYNPWYDFALKFHSACSYIAGTSVLLYFAKAICGWRVFIDEMSSPTTASPSGLIFMTMTMSFVGKFGSFGALLVFVASFLHLILVIWFIYMSLAYQTMPDPSWFANTIGIGLCAVKVWFYSPLSGHFLIALTLMLTFVYYPISLIRVALNEKMSATICWMNMMGPAVSLYSLAIIMEPTFQQERPDISHFQMVQRSIYIPTMTCLFGLCIIGMISSVHGFIVRWRQLSRETFSPAHAAYSFPLLMHAMAVQSYRSSLDFFSPPEVGSPVLEQTLRIYWLITVVVGTIAALTCIIMYFVFLPSWVDVDTRDELEPPPPNETSICNNVTYGESLIQSYTSPTILQANETGTLIMVHDYQNDWWDLVRTRRIPAYGFEPRMRNRSFVRERNALKLFMGWQDVILEGDEGGDDVQLDDEEKNTSLPTCHEC